MTTRLYVIFDRLAEECGPIFEAKTDAVAVRNFNHMFSKEGISARPDEYWLYMVGELNHDTMAINQSFNRVEAAKGGVKDEEE